MSSVQPRATWGSVRQQDIIASIRVSYGPIMAHIVGGVILYNVPAEADRECRAKRHRRQQCTSQQHNQCSPIARHSLSRRYTCQQNSRCSLLDHRSQPCQYIVQQHIQCSLTLHHSQFH
jgi:hypothetical protein